MKKLLPVFILLSIIFFSACRKEEPIAVSGNPVFSAHGTLGTASLDLVAGQNNYYMYSSYSSDALDIYEFKGELKEYNSASYSPNSLTVRIRDYMPHSSQQPDIDSSLAPGFYNYQIPDSGYTVSFTSLAYGDTNITVFWDFGDLTTSTQLNPVHTYATAGNYTVQFSAIGWNTFNGDSMQMVVSQTQPCMSVDFISFNAGGDSLTFNPIITGGQSPYTYSWDFGDSNTSTLAIPTNAYTTAGKYSVILTVTDANNCTVTKQHRVCTGNGVGATADFTWQNTTPTPNHFSEVVIEWTDANGTVYTSDNAAQPGNSTFQVLSVDEYEPNANGQRTKKIHLLANCILYNGSNTLVLQNADLVFAFAYP